MILFSQHSMDEVVPIVGPSVAASPIAFFRSSGLPHKRSGYPSRESTERLCGQVSWKGEAGRLHGERKQLRHHHWQDQQNNRTKLGSGYTILSKCNGYCFNSLNCGVGYTAMDKRSNQVREGSYNLIFRMKVMDVPVLLGLAVWFDLANRMWANIMCTSCFK